MPKENVYTDMVEIRDEYLVQGQNQIDKLKQVGAGQRSIEDLALIAQHDWARMLLDAKDTGELAFQLRLEVGWSKESGHVGFGFAGHDHSTGETIPVPGHFTDLNWVQINQLIRALRTARDQAFGTPE